MESGAHHATHQRSEGGTDRSQLPREHDARSEVRDPLDERSGSDPAMITTADEASNVRRQEGTGRLRDDEGDEERIHQLSGALTEPETECSPAVGSGRGAREEQIQIREVGRCQNGRRHALTVTCSVVSSDVGDERRDECRVDPEHQRCC